MKGLGAAGAVASTVAAVVVFALTRDLYARHFASELHIARPLDVARFFGAYGDAMSMSLILAALAATLTLVAIVLANGIRLAGQWPMHIESHALGRWLLATAAAFVVLVPLASWLGDDRGTKFLAEAYRSASVKWLVVAAIAFAMPVMEELAVRGVLLPALARTRLHERGAILATALAFSLAHGARHPVALATIFAFGIILAMARLRTGSVAVPLAMHMAWNGAICLAMVYA